MEAIHVVRTDAALELAFNANHWRQAAQPLVAAGVKRQHLRFMVHPHLLRIAASATAEAQHSSRAAESFARAVGRRHQDLPDEAVQRPKRAALVEAVMAGTRQLRFFGIAVHADPDMAEDAIACYDSRTAGPNDVLAKIGPPVFLTIP